MNHTLFKQSAPKVRAAVRQRSIQAVLCAIVYVSAFQAHAAPNQALLDRGNYLVNGILTCGACHTPRAPNGEADMRRQLSGGSQSWDENNYQVKGANITQDRESGIGKWSSAQLKHTLLTGVRPDGRQLAPVMPYGFYKAMTSADMDAVVAYIKTVPAFSNVVQAPVYSGPMDVRTPPGTKAPMREAGFKDPVKLGFYLASIGHCMECHTPSNKGGRDFKQLGQGGQVFQGPFGISVSRNITSDPTSGLGKWSDEQIKAAITQGRHIDGSQLKPPMSYSQYATMTPTDLSAIVAYLRTVPAKN